MLSKQARIYIAGHRGLVGSAIYRCLHAAGFTNLITRTHAELDLTQQAATQAFFAETRPDYVIVAAAKVGGIYANNTFPAEFIYTNLMIEANIIHAAYQANVQNLLFLGSVCIYPKFAELPVREEALLTGILEPTNEPYAIAKIAGIKLCEAYNRQYGTSYYALMPANLYGINDNFHPENSHVIPGLMRRFYDAKRKNASFFNIWGTGQARREFLYADDLADACLFLLQQPSLTAPSALLNVGAGVDISITELAKIIQELVGYIGEIHYDTQRPDGTPSRLMDSSRLFNLGWRPKTSLRSGLEKTYQWFLQHHAEA